MRLSRRLLVLLALLAILAIAGWWAVPFLLVAGLLLNGWYVGEDRILALRARRPAPRLRPARTVRPRALYLGFASLLERAPRLERGPPAGFAVT
jgi:hypothetical protein